jgi:stage II sporulation protein D
MRTTIFIVFLFLSTEIMTAQSISISVFNGKQINSFTVDIKQGKYLLKSGKKTLGEYKKGNIFYITRYDNLLEVHDKQNQIGMFEELSFSCFSGDGIITLKPVTPLLEGYEYDDDFIMVPVNTHIQVINKLDMEKYIAAVIEAEGGNHSPAEYYKAQAVLIRTYTIKNMFKHAEEGFNLCDQVHCQAYKGRSSQNPLILEATRSTAGLVLIDRDSILVMSPFHSNCGGETSAAGMVWQKDIPYLQSIKDPFCTRSPHAHWSVTITRTQWNNFLNIYTSGKTYNLTDNFSFNLARRTRDVTVNGISLNLRTVREYFNLKSTLFSLSDSGAELVINGRGYGHGVGMCQEGAIEMAKVGYTWLDIIYFYSQNILLADYRDMEPHRY